MLLYVAYVLNSIEPMFMPRKVDGVEDGKVQLMLVGW